MSFSSRSMSCVAALAAATIAFATTSANAGAGVQFALSIDGGAPFVFNPPSNPLGGGNFNYQGDLNDVGFSLGWDLNVGTDPYVSGNIVIINTGFAPTTFSLTILLPTSTFGTDTTIGGSIAGGLTTDQGGGFLSSVAGTPVWSAIIDNAVVATMLNDPFMVSKAGAGSVGIGPESFGVPIPSLAAPAVAQNIGINLTFTLSEGDQASFTSVFVVKPIPAPAGLALLGVAGLLGGRRRRA